MILLALIFVGLASLCLALLTDNLRFAFRIPLIVCIPFLWAAIWQAAQPPSGWPAHTKPPESAQFLSGVVREPNRVEKDPGEIDVWLIPADGTRPRAYQLQYTRRLHEQVMQAVRRAAQGERVAVRMIRKGKRERGPKIRVLVYHFPDPQSPPKD